jgi:hypothetical protein
MQRQKSEWEEGDIVRVLAVNKVGRVWEVLPGGRYRVKEVPTARINEPGRRPHGEDSGEIGVFSAEELELEL